MTNSEEICQTDRPVSLNSSVYTGYSRTNVEEQVRVQGAGQPAMSSLVV